MLTRCPNPQCKLTFDVPDAREGKNGPCPQCGQVITFRSLAVLNEIERQHQLREQREPLPEPDWTRPPQFSALLEDIRSLWNVGSIFRTADAAGIGLLHLCGITGCPPRKEIAKTSLGAEESVPWRHASSALDVLPHLKENGVQLVVLEKTETGIDLTEALKRNLIKTPLCLAVGNEVAGVSAEVLARADVVVHLPMRGMKSSLNVAVAFGIAAYGIVEGCSPQRHEDRKAHFG